jgi:hypothetical protein
MRLVIHAALYRLINEEPRGGGNRNLIVTHDVIVFLVMHLKPTWLAEVSIGSA